MFIVKKTGWFRELIRVIFILALTIPKLYFAQTNNIDSLLSVIKTKKEDTSKVSALNILVTLYNAKQKLDLAAGYSNQLLVLSEKLNYKKGIYLYYFLNANTLYRKGKNTEAITDYLKALAYFKSVNDISNIASVSGAMGTTYYRMGAYPKALEANLTAVKNFEAINNKRSAAGFAGNIGAIYNKTMNNEKALEFYLKALKINEEIKAEQSIAINLVCIANVYTQQKKYEDAETYFAKALKINEKVGNKEYIANNLGNLGSNNFYKGKYELSLDYFLKAKAIYDERNDKNSLTEMTMQIGRAYLNMKKYDEAEKYLLDALNLAKETGLLEQQKHVYLALHNLYLETEKYKESLEYYKKSKTANDSLFNIGNEKVMLQKQMQYDYDKKESEAKLEFEKQQAVNQLEIEKRKQSITLLEKDNALKELSLNQSNLELKQKKTESESQKKQVELLNKDKQLQEANALQKNKELEKQKLVRNGLIGGALLLLIFAFIILKSLGQSKKNNKIIASQKSLVESQKHEVEEKNKEITDSITYAKRLQQAILPPQDYINRYLPDNFVLYKPKDIVAGDFYWMETISSEQDDIILIAAADSTGHGVPGAMVSVVCSNALNRSVKEFKLTNPGKILDQTRELVLETFSKSESEVKDGMDISLLMIKRNKQRIIKEVAWSGANNPLWYIQDNILKEIKANKQPIGLIENPQPFQTHYLEFNTGDIFYLFTDGFADQFGGPKGKKFKYKQLSHLLVTIQNKNFTEQKKLLAGEFSQWKGKLEQVDDVCIIGIKL